MGPFFERLATPDFLSHDFFTQASSQLNPRFVFGYTVIALSKVLQVNWVQGLWFLSLCFTVFLPLLFYRLLLRILAPHLNETQFSVSALVAWIGVLLVSLHNYQLNPSLSKRSKSEVKHKVMHHYILKAAALKEKGRPSRLKTE